MLRRFTLALGLLFGWVSPQANAEQVAIDVIKWNLDAHRFGGFSGLEVSSDGASFSAINDMGIVFRGDLERNTRGQLTGISSADTSNLLFEPGEQPVGKRFRDTEAMATSSTGLTAISVEGDHRVMVYHDLTKSPTQLIALDGFRLGTNSGVEALAVSPTGHYVAIPERSHSIITPYPVKIYRNGRWDPLALLPRKGGFRPVGADFAPDGSLFVLSRAFSGFAFASRIDRITFDDENAPTVSPVFASNYGRFDNLEGLATWVDKTGKLRILLISDDNFNDFQTTQFVEITTMFSLR